MKAETAICSVAGFVYAILCGMSVSSNNAVAAAWWAFATAWCVGWAIYFSRNEKSCDA